MTTQRKSTLPQPAKMRVTLARISSTGAIASYALAAIMFFYGFSNAGFGFVALTLLMCCLLLGTGVYRIAGGKPEDEFEKSILYKASYYSYAIVGGGLIIGIFAFSVLVDSKAIDHFEDPSSFILYGAILIVMVVPAACVAWLLPRVEMTAED